MLQRVYRKFGQKATLLGLILLFLATPVLATNVPNDPGYDVQKAIWIQIGAPDAWNATVGSAAVVVAVIDTGADIWHSDLSGNIWSNPYEIPDNGIDDDHNGYVDDLHGWNFVENDNNLHESASASNAKQDSQSTVHGTVISGLIGAVGDNAVDGTGLNWRVKIMPLRAIESNGSGKYSNVIRAVQYAVDNGASVIIMSFVGDEESFALEDVLYRAYQRGVVIVTAAGNHDPEKPGNFAIAPHYPACYNQKHGGKWLLTVGSVDENDKLSSFSNFGKCLDIVAPGEKLYSSEWYAPALGYNTEFGGPWYGTSFAAPLVGGTAALIKSIHPEWNADKIISTIVSTADNVDSANVPPLGVGRLNAGKAVTLAAATIPLPVGWQDPIYTVRSGALWRYYPGQTQSELIGKPERGQLVAVSSARHDPGEYIFMLRKVGANYYLHAVKSNGEFLFDRPVPVPAAAGKNPIAVSLSASIDTVGAPVLMYNWIDNAKRSIFSLTDYSGSVLTQHIIKPAVAAWGYDGTTQDFYWAQVVRGKATVYGSNWDTGTLTATDIKDVIAVDDLKVLPNDVAISFRTALDARLGLIDRTSTEAIYAVPGKGRNSPPWYLWIVHNSLTGAVGVVPFPFTKAGDRLIFDSKTNRLGTLTVPTLTGFLGR